MPFTTPGDVHISAPLTNVAISYTQQEENFVAARVFPIVPVQKQSDTYYTFDRDEENRDEMQMRAPGTESAGGTIQTSTDTYYAKIWAWHYDISDPVRANSDSNFNLDRMASRRVAHKGLLKLEGVFATTFLASGVWTSEVSGDVGSPGVGNVMHWNDAASTPIEDVRAAATAVQVLTGYRPNKLVLGQQVWDALINHPDIVDRIKYSSSPGNPAIVSRQTVAALFEVKEVLVMAATRNTAAEGAAAARSFIGGKHALLVYTPDTPSIDEPSAGYIYAWTGYTGAGPNGMRVAKFRMEPIKSDRIEGELAFDMKKTAADLGYLFADIVA